MDVLVALIHRQYDHAGVGMLAADRHYGIETARLTQPQIHECDVRPVLIVFLQRLLARCRKPDHFHVRFTRDDKRDPLAHEAMVVHAQDPDDWRSHVSIATSSRVTSDVGTIASTTVPLAITDSMRRDPPSSSARSSIVSTP